MADLHTLVECCHYRACSNPTSRRYHAVGHLLPSLKVRDCTSLVSSVDQIHPRGPGSSPSRSWCGCCVSPPSRNSIERPIQSTQTPEGPESRSSCPGS